MYGAGGLQVGCWCMSATSIRHSSWFRHSDLTLLKVLLLACAIVRRMPARDIQLQLQVEHTTVYSSAGRLYWTASREHVTTWTGWEGWGKLVKIYDSCIGRSQYNRHRLRNAKSVFGNAERVSGKKFLIPVPDRCEDTAGCLPDFGWVVDGYYQWLLWDLHASIGSWLHATVKPSRAPTHRHSHQLLACQRLREHIHYRAECMFCAIKHRRLDGFFAFFTLCTGRSCLRARTCASDLLCHLSMMHMGTLNFSWEQELIVRLLVALQTQTLAMWEHLYFWLCTVLPIFCCTAVVFWDTAGLGSAHTASSVAVTIAANT
jgi:hypothetical protein